VCGYFREYNSMLPPAVMMTAIAKRRGPGLLAHAEPGVFWCVELNLQAPERHAFNGFMLAIAKRLFFTQSAGAPGIYFFRYHGNHHGFFCRYLRFIH